MTENRNILLVVENPPDQRFAEGILKSEVDEGLIVFNRGWEASGALSTALSSLYVQPQRPVALLINTATEDPIEVEEQFRGPVLRMLSQFTHSVWHAAFAIPRLDAWATADPRVREAFEQHEAEHGRSSYAERSQRFLELVKEQPFDREALCRSNDEARGLIEFIERTCAQMHSAASTA